MARPAVFLDRDGTLVEDVDFLTEPDQLVLLPGAAAAVRALNEAGVAVALVTNQSGVARGLLDEERLRHVHERLAEMLAEGGARLDGIWYCPHHPDEGEPPYRAACECRKPAPGLLRAAADALDLDLARSFVVGDSVRDVEAGAALGVPGILVATGNGARQRASLGRVTGPAPRFAPDLAAAVRMVLASLARSEAERQGR